MMLGIRTVVGNNPTGHALQYNASGANGAQPTAAQVAAEAAALKRKNAIAAQGSLTQMVKLSFPGKGSNSTPAHAMRDFKFKSVPTRSSGRCVQHALLAPAACADAIGGCSCAVFLFFFMFLSLSLSLCIVGTIKAIFSVQSATVSASIPLNICYVSAVIFNTSSSFPTRKVANFSSIPMIDNI